MKVEDLPGRGYEDIRTFLESNRTEVFTLADLYNKGLLPGRPQGRYGTIFSWFGKEWQLKDPRTKAHYLGCPEVIVQAKKMLGLED